MSTEHVTSTGHDVSDSGWLDQHFNFSHEAYEAMVQWTRCQHASILWIPAVEVASR